MNKHIFRQTCRKLLVVLLLSILSFCYNRFFQFLVAKRLSLGYLFYYIHLFYLISVNHPCIRDVSVGFLRQRACLLYSSRNSTGNTSNSPIGDCDDTEILPTQRAIQTANTDDLGTQTSKEAVSQLVDQSKTVILVKDKNEPTEEKQIIAVKTAGTNDFIIAIVIFIVILNYHRHYFIKIRMDKD